MLCLNNGLFEVDHYQGGYWFFEHLFFLNAIQQYKLGRPDPFQIVINRQSRKERHRNQKQNLIYVNLKQILLQSFLY